MFGGFRTGTAFVLCLAFVSSAVVVLELPGMASAYTVHDPIFIDGNEGFTPENGITSGSGTQEDPYVIEGWEVDGENGRYCISVSDTDCHFIIRDCVLWNASTHTIPYGHGIHLDGVSNCTITDNTVFECYTGMFLESSSNNTISGNSIFDISHMGLQLFSFCSDNMICGNQIRSISYDAICVWNGSNRNMIVENWLHNNTFDGVDLMRSTANVISSNLIETCGSFGVNCAYAISSNDTMICGNTIRQCNYGASLTGWRNTLYANTFWECQQGVRLILGEEQNVVMNDVRLSRGISLEWTNNSLLYCNNLTSCSGFGPWLDQSGAITLSSSNANLILNNELYGNSVYGVAIDAGSEGNCVIGCNFVENNGAQSTYNKNSVQAFDDGDSNRWDESYRGNHWSDWAEPDDNADGIVDEPYMIDGTVAAKDNYPLINPVSGLGAFGETEALISGVEGDDGWFVSPVEVQLTIGGVWLWGDKTYSRIDSVDWQTYSNPFQITSEGVHTLEFYSEDILGNSESIQTVEIKIDCSAPSLALITQNNTLFQSGNVSITWVCDDSVSGIDRVEYSLDGGPYTSCQNLSGAHLSELSDGQHQLMVRAHDEAGNSIGAVLMFQVTLEQSDYDEEDADWGMVLTVAAIGIAVSVVATVAMLKRRRPPPQG